MLNNKSDKTKILLCTLNSRYIHSAFGLKYLYANLSDRARECAKVLEFTINQDTRKIAEEILAHDPELVGFGVYIWNTRETEDLVSLLKRLRPQLKIILGGPEVSYETESQNLSFLADHVFIGEADFSLRDYCDRFLNGEESLSKIIRAPQPDILAIRSPYPYYTDDDVKNRVIYVEASRGCPYKCEYCLSSLDKSVRNFDTSAFLKEMDTLIKRGTRQFKFVDRTFNLSPTISLQILQFFLDRMHLGLFLHFEMVPDRLPENLRDAISKFPKGALQFEIGIQTFNPETSRLVSRKNDLEKTTLNFKFLKEQTQVHTHADLIVGLPAENLESFGTGFDALYEMGPDEVQVGLLKRLKGTPIVRHDQEWEMIYQSHPPFQILSTKTMDFVTIQKMTRFSKYWDLVANSGNFKRTLQLFWDESIKKETHSTFWAFFGLSEYLNSKHPTQHSIALQNLVETVWHYFKEEFHTPDEILENTLLKDYCFDVKRDLPPFLKSNSEQKTLKNTHTPKRQARHLTPMESPQSH